MGLLGEYNSPGSLGGTTLGTKDQALAKVRSLDDLTQGEFASYWESTIQPAMEVTMSKLSPTASEGFQSRIPFAHIDSLPTVYEMAHVARKLMDKLTETRQISPSTSS